MFTLKRKSEMPSAADALPGRPTPIPTAKQHAIFSRVAERLDLVLPESPLPEPELPF